MVQLDTDASQSCQLTTVNGCDSVAILNLTITQSDTSFTELRTRKLEWNGKHILSGVYEYSNKMITISMSFDGNEIFT